MNYPPPTSPAPAAVRNRRSGRPPAKRKKRKSGAGLALWQWIVLAMLLIGLIYAIMQLGQANASLSRLQKERQEAREKYEQTVRNHQVKYRDLIEQYSAEYNLNPAFVSAIIMQESGYDPRAVSSKGAMGLMQFMPNTFDWVKKNCGYRNADVDVLYQPEAAIKMGCYLLNYITKQINSDDPVLVACAYHAGWGNVPTWIENYSTDGKTLAVSQIPKSDTRTYAGRVLNSYAIYLQHYY